MIAVVMVVTVAATQVGAAVVARHRAQAAADLAALAAAAWLVGGPGAACEAAQTVVTAMRAQNSGCATDGLDVVVRVEIPVHVGRWGAGYARASARAGPVAGDGRQR